MAGFDTHIHSTASDGGFSPAEVVTMAHERGLLGLALTDHDTVNGVAAAAAKAKELDITFIPGIELSAEMMDRDIHILGYWLDPEKLMATGRLQHLAEARKQRAEEIAHRLHLLGMDIDLEEIKAEVGDNTIGRPHIALAMVKEGYVDNLRTAFNKWLGRGMPAYVPREKLMPVEAVHLILTAGGVPAIAHPGTGVPDDLIPRLIKEGVGGLEVYHPEHNHAMEQKYLRIARRYQIAALGGSDFHVKGIRDIGCRVTTVSQLGILAKYKRDERDLSGI